VQTKPKEKQNGIKKKNLYVCDEAKMRTKTTGQNRKENTFGLKNSTEFVY